MARQPRDQTTGCFHHVMGRGCRGQPIFANEFDREHFAYLLRDVAERFEWSIIDWVLMPNHHHLLLRLAEPNLSQGMHRLHFMYGQRWNERTPSRGHVYFGRYKNVPLHQERAAVRVMRYIDLNPVRAGLCARPEDWEWSGYGANVGRRAPLDFHDTATALQVMAPYADDVDQAKRRYARSVRERLAATLGRGKITDVRPTLDEILVPGDIESIREATDTWWYSARDVASHIGCSHVTILNWLHAPPAIRSSTVAARWTSGREWSA